MRSLLWSDEFDGPEGSAPNPEIWSHEIGGGGWGDSQLQTYTDSVANARITADGQLAITAHADLTSARLRTKGLRHAGYGRIEARIKLPTGAGLWPAFWMLGTDLDEAGWPACGEIDVMEFVSSGPSTVHGTIHLPGFAGVGTGIGHAHDSGVTLSDNFHVFAVDWSRDGITWLLDDEPFFSVGRDELPQWPFDHDFFLLINLAIGGGWPGNDHTADLPATMLVDWVRVWSEQAL